MKPQAIAQKYQGIDYPQLNKPLVLPAATATWSISYNYFSKDILLFKAHNSMRVQAGFSPYRANVDHIAPLTVEKASTQTSHNPSSQSLGSDRPVQQQALLCKLCVDFAITHKGTFWTICDRLATNLKLFLSYVTAMGIIISKAVT